MELEGDDRTLKNLLIESSTNLLTTHNHPYCQFHRYSDNKSQVDSLEILPRNNRNAAKTAGVRCLLYRAIQGRVISKSHRNICDAYPTLRVTRLYELSLFTLLNTNPKTVVHLISADAKQPAAIIRETCQSESNLKNRSPPLLKPRANVFP
jgi:hypothetical protein